MFNDTLVSDAQWDSWTSDQKRHRAERWEKTLANELILYDIPDEDRPENCRTMSIVTLRDFLVAFYTVEESKPTEEDEIALRLKKSNLTNGDA